MQFALCRSGLLENLPFARGARPRPRVFQRGAVRGLSGCDADADADRDVRVDPDPDVRLILLLPTRTRRRPRTHRQHALQPRPQRLVLRVPIRMRKRRRTGRRGQDAPFEAAERVLVVLVRLVVRCVQVGAGSRLELGVPVVRRCADGRGVRCRARACGA
ncbi:hypothetical protein B0H12DRAFT_63506 [Mycena haematopus]|nr:hypothetical protein B0H12DRAFT_63506 [Mycena haematopus]